MEGLIRALHRSNQKGYPIIIYAAGLPKIAKFVGVAKSYAERLFSFVEIDSLDAIAAEKALVYPAKEMGVAYTPKAINHILSKTKGYPYFIQEYGKWIWKHRHNSDIITDEIAVTAYNDFEKSLESGFFRVRYDKATTKELDFMLAMVECGELPCTIKNVAEILGVTQQRISAVRAQLIHKGFIYAANYGKLDFPVWTISTQTAGKYCIRFTKNRKLNKSEINTILSTNRHWVLFGIDFTPFLIH